VLDLQSGCNGHCSDSVIRTGSSWLVLLSMHLSSLLMLSFQSQTSVHEACTCCASIAWMYFQISKAHTITSAWAAKLHWRTCVSCVNTAVVRKLEDFLLLI